jgi:hypothetical protein
MKFVLSQRLGLGKRLVATAPQVKDRNIVHATTSASVAGVQQVVHELLMDLCPDIRYHG